MDYPNYVPDGVRVEAARLWHVASAEYLAERRQMMQTWSDFVDAQVEGGNVTIGRFGKDFRAG